MANTITSTGIQTQTLDEIITELTEAYKSIYGYDINVASDTQDGQTINIFAKAKRDVLNFAVQIYDSMNPDTVFGQAQDQLYKLVGLYRLQSTFSFVNINVNITQPVNLVGLDGDINNEDASGFTVADSSGNNFILANSVSLATPGTYFLEFRAANSGAVQVLPNTINNLVTVLLGVASCNNPAEQYLTGNTAETDAEFRIRFNKSRSIGSQGFEDSLYAQLLNTQFVTQVYISQNRTDTTNADGTPGHTIWVIVEGGSDEDIAKVIYANLTDGCGMRGNTTYSVQKANGQFQLILFDRPTSTPLYVRGNIKNLTNQTLDLNSIKASLIDSLDFDINQMATSADVTCSLNNISNGTFVPYDIEVSTDGQSYTSYVETARKDQFFALVASNINLTVV